MALRKGLGLCQTFRQEVNCVVKNHRYMIGCYVRQDLNSRVNPRFRKGVFYSKCDNINFMSSHRLRTLCTESSDGRSIFSYRNVDYVVNVKTGDQLHAGTDANVYISLYSETGEKTERIKLDYFFRDDFERGQLDSFQLKNIPRYNEIIKIELWRDNAGFGSDWFVDYIEIESIDSRKRFMFPLFRWIKPDRRYIIHHMDNYLPQFDPLPDYRLEEVEIKRAAYECQQKVPNGPSQVKLFLFIAPEFTT